ncbi:MAG: hypothetical protein OXR73_16060 [Myxococcales bacterium]|nr:hypothetical protein [Myxococcales bacterium]
MANGSSSPRGGLLCIALAMVGCSAGPLGAGAGDAGASLSPWGPDLELPDPEGFAGTFLLSETGLYEDIGDKRVGSDAIAFEPSYPLWTDGARKRRWLRLPPDAVVDTTDQDHWQFPIGTMAFKEFMRDGQRIETRLIVRTGSGPEDYWMGAFVWDEHEDDARFVPGGLPDVRGTDHDVPKVKQCFTCHRGERGRVLGFSAVQGTGVDPSAFDALPVPYVPPGDATAVAALGYLHGNCAHCHNPRGSARPDTDMNLRLSVTDMSVQDTQTYVTTLSIPLQYFEGSPLQQRVVPGAPGQSGLLFRMMERGPDTQMPPIGTELVDPAGLAAVETWIAGLRSD